MKISNVIKIASAALTSCVLTNVALSQEISTSRYTPSAAAGQTTIGARIGMVSVNTIDSNLGSYGAFGDYTLDDRIVVGGSVDYWGMSTGNVAEDRISVNDLSIGGNGKFIFANVQSAFKPYLMAGLAGHRLSSSQSRIDDDSSSINRYRERNNSVSTEASLDTGGGAIYTVQKNMDLTGQVLYRRMLASSSSYNQLGLTAGFGYRM
ncbi:MAG: hypothetical protein NT027_07030 [Proteobacteria bacterium]|nr:hypothetical protein [Pseudomonadota bacterium]